MFTLYIDDPRLNVTHWTRPKQIPGAWSREGPALITHMSLAKWGTNPHNLVYVAFRSRTDNQIWIGSYDGEFWILHGTVPGQYTNMAPALVSFGGTLYVVCRGHNNPLVWYREIPVDTYQHIKFRAIPHYFKMGNLDEAEDDQCRRLGTRRVVSGGPCECPPPNTMPPQAVYPQCIPAAWARLLGAYRLVLPPEQRRWEIGTPSDPDPPPGRDGDYVSTHSIGVEDRRNPSRVEDWPDRHPIPIESLPFDIDPTDEVAIQERADAIERELKTLVPKRPVYIEHNGHAWNIFGSNAFGYYSHGQNPEAAGLTDWCSWENAPWRNAERQYPHYALLLRP
jgi:hypothetical protein